MFGDIGHGFLLFLIASVICLFGEYFVKKFKGIAPIYKLRYMLLLMGVFSTYCGFIYNDFMGIPLNIFGSCYNLKTGQRKDPNCVYPLGIDPVWAMSKQDIIFTNSIKMKFAVIIGVSHMMIGLVQKGFNAAYFKQNLDILHEWIPQMLVMILLFGYMDFMIIVKWLSNYQGYENEAPNIISTMTGIFLENGRVDGRPLFYGHEVCNVLIFCNYTLFHLIFRDCYNMCALDAPSQTLNTLGQRTKVKEISCNERRCGNARASV